MGQGWSGAGATRRSGTAWMADRPRGAGTRRRDDGRQLRPRTCDPSRRRPPRRRFRSAGAFRRCGGVLMAIGWVIAAIGLALVVFPQPLMVAARGWRLGMPRTSELGGVHAAR